MKGLFCMNCYQASLRLLTKRDYSIYKLSKKLLEKGYDQIEVDETIDELLAKKYLKEEFYIEAFVKGHMRKGYAPSYIQQKLAQENCSCSLEFIYEIFDEYKFSEEKQIRDLIDKKYSRIDTKEFKNKAKIMRFLLSKGHESQLAQHILSNL